MFRIFVIIISCLSLSAAAATPDTLDQIKADLLAKKAKEEPFKDKDVKVDLESLGLDEIDAKDAKIASDKAPPKPVEEKPIVGVISADLPEIKKTTDLEKTKLIEPAPAPSAPVTFSDKVKKMEEKVVKNLMPKSEVKSGEESLGTIEKIQNFLHKSDDKKQQETNKDVDVKKEAAVETPPSQPTPESAKVAAKKEAFINSKKKVNLKKQAAAKKAAKKKSEENEKKRKARLAKLNQLRAKYLIKINNEKSGQDGNIDEDLSDIDTKIVPQRKNINKFVSYERPAPPIMDRYRNHDNIGIPVVITNQEKADILFRSIGQEDISYFNSAYNGVENSDLRNYAGDTILTYAILLQKREVVASILAKGANPNLLNGLGYSPLQITIESLDLASFNLLVSRNADVNYVDGFGRTYLMHAARLGFLPAIEALIKKGVDVNAMDYDGFSALAIANKYNQQLAVAMLLKNGAKPWVEKIYDPEAESIIKQLENKWKK